MQAINRSASRASSDEKQRKKRLKIHKKSHNQKGCGIFFWRCRPDLNWCVAVLQTAALPLGYGTIWSGLRGSNSLPPPWQGGALPDELNPQKNRTYSLTALPLSCIHITTYPLTCQHLFLFFLLYFFNREGCIGSCDPLQPSLIFFIRLEQRSNRVFKYPG